MTAKILHIQVLPIKKVVDEIHKQFAYAADGSKKADRARLRAGQLLNDLRGRIEGGEIGENINWWKWYDENFARSKKDAMKVMKLASAEDPEAAHEEEKSKKRKVAPGDQSEVADLVTHALHLVEEMDANQRQRFFAEIRRSYAYSL
jgi:undecaprenyl pyrophosphate synthase